MDLKDGYVGSAL